MNLNEPALSADPGYLYRGPYRPLTQQDVVIADVVTDAVARSLQALERNHFEEALFDLDTALAVMPKMPIAHWNRGQVLLAMGRYEEGFKEYEWRFSLFADWIASHEVALWKGEDIAGKRLLLYHEWGFGDSIMLLRYIPQLKAMGARITLVVPKTLRELARQFPIDVAEDVPTKFAGFDYRCPMFNLPANLQQTILNIPNAPYLSATKTKPRLSDRPTIGIAWSGDRNHPRDRHRSIDLDQLISSLNCCGHVLCSIQTQEFEAAKYRGVMTPAYDDWTDTAAYLMQMDHIVAVDTASAHLAGAMGHPSVHVLLPFCGYWPWYNSKAWYPRMNVYRQDKPGDWASVFARVNAKLNEGTMPCQ